MSGLSDLALDFALKRRAYLDSVGGCTEESRGDDGPPYTPGNPRCRWAGAHEGLAREEWCEPCRKADRLAKASSYAWRKFTRAFRDQEPAPDGAEGRE